MAASGSRNSAIVLFTDDELKDMNGLTKGINFVEVSCGCTSKYGDTAGKLKVFRDGDLKIRCECSSCNESIFTPAEFEEHALKGYKRWKQTIWIIIKGKKVSLLKTALLRYYKQEAKSTKGHRGRKRRSCHHDEFIRCTVCNKERRFTLRDKKECRNYHDARAKPNWRCTDFPSNKFSCDAVEERQSRKVLRRCFRLPSCEGCNYCVCLGCEMCRFSDCSCQTCVDFMKNAAN
ncbi:protein ULTRAPETALA 1-like [Elaeis guineensis]|uniref:Protein ULTRAPETALA 1-like n=1 Tax=Elaeis guineensis var. tenera TaxID=51953 RepID=A0A6I9R9B9_ELAGV|nr:protein ULTRAPETALA 1-like [Elaeis guineensis]